MKKVYVLMYWSDEDGLKDVNTGETTPPKLKPYAVFEDKFTAERMKRNGDEIFEVLFFEDPTERIVQAVERCKEEKPQLVFEPWQVKHTWPQNEDSTLAPFDPPSYPKVTCDKTVDEHRWTNRVD